MAFPLYIFLQGNVPIRVHLLPRLQESKSVESNRSTWLKDTLLAVDAPPARCV